MSPDDLAQLHPRLFHVTAAGGARDILERGLLSTRDILDRWELPEAMKQTLTRQRRPLSRTLTHPRHGTITINDNAPLHEGKLARVLDDGLVPGDWLEMLNSRVFFFVRKQQVERLSNARLNRDRARDVIVIDTLGLARAYCDRMEIVPINSGNTNHNAARRGRATFAPLPDTDYPAWRRRRGRVAPDTIKEIAVRGSIPDIADFVVSPDEGAVPK